MCYFVITLFSKIFLTIPIIAHAVIHTRSNKTDHGNPVVTPTSCVSLTDQHKIAYIGWPMNLSCEIMNMGLKQGNESSGNLESETSCKIWNGSHYFENSVKVPTSNNWSYEVEVYSLSKQFSKSYCVNLTVKVTFQLLQSSSCKEDFFTSENFSNLASLYGIVDISAEMHGESLCLPCELENSSMYMPIVENLSDLSVTWYRTRVDRFRQPKPSETCKPVSLKDKDRCHSTPSDLFLHNINYFTPAIYSCAVTYNKTTAFLSHYRVCVRQSFQKVQPTMTCTKEVRFHEGNTKTVACDIQTDFKVLQNDELIVNWSKSKTPTHRQNTVCEINNISQITKVASTKISCGLTDFQNVPRKCFFYVPKDLELNNQSKQNTYSAYLKLRNMQKEDQGTYLVQLWHRNSSTESVKFEVVFDQTNELWNYLIILLILLGLLLAAVLAVLLVYKNLIRIKLFIRRHHGKYDKDDKEFVAILSYVVPQNQSKQKEMLTKIRSWICEQLEKMNYSYYDEHEHFEPGHWAENIFNHLDKSHRMIVILSGDYVNEVKARFEASQALHNMLANKTKLIFISLPCGRKAMKTISNDVKFKSELQQGYKAARTIKYKDNMSERRFKESVEYALPKLNRHGIKEQFIANGNANIVRYTRMVSSDSIRIEANSA